MHHDFCRVRKYAKMYSNMYTLIEKADTGIEKAELEFCLNPQNTEVQTALHQCGLQGPDLPLPVQTPQMQRVMRKYLQKVNKKISTSCLLA